MKNAVVEKNGPYKIKQTNEGKFELYGWDGEWLDEFDSLAKAKTEMANLIYIDCCNGDLDYEDNND